MRISDCSSDVCSSDLVALANASPISPKGPCTMLRVMTIVGTRPELIRLSLTIEKLDRFCDHRLVHTGQNYDFELNEIFFRDLGIRAPDCYLDAAGATAAETIDRKSTRLNSRHSCAPRMPSSACT